MKRTTLLLAITLMVTSFGISQVLGPPNYNVKEKPHTQSTVDKELPPGPTSFAAECSINETCVIDYPRPIDNPLIKSSSAVVLTKAQIDLQILPVIYVNNGTAKPGDKKIYKCVIAELASETSANARSHPRMFCTAVGSSVGGE